MRLLSPFVALSATLFFHACGSEKNNTQTENDGLLLADSSSRGLLLTTVENYLSSRLYFYDFLSGTKTQIMSGESGDPGLFSSRDQIFFFNRTSDNSNLRTISVVDSSPKVGIQNALPGAGAGDPQAVFHLDDRFLLLSFWASGKLGIFDLQSSALVQTVDLPFDVGVGNVFRPSALSGSNSEIYVVHQGIASDGVTLNGSQQIFILTWKDNALSATDIDTNKEKIQGIPLHISNPTATFLSTNGQELTIAGSCTIFNDTGCVSGFEKVDLAARTSSLAYDMSALPEKNNGAVVAIDDHSYYAQLIIADATSDLSKSEKIAARIDTTAKTITQIHVYPADSNGCCGLFYDQSSKKLLITDYSPSEGGSITLMDDTGAEVRKVAVENTPYNGIIIP